MSKVKRDLATVRWVFEITAMQEAIAADPRGVQEIAEAAGTRHSTLYRYMAGTQNIRSDILYAVWREILK